MGPEGTGWWEMVPASTAGALMAREASWRVGRIASPQQMRRRSSATRSEAEGRTAREGRAISASRGPRCSDYLARRHSLFGRIAAPREPVQAKCHRNSEGLWC